MTGERNWDEQDWPDAPTPECQHNETEEDGIDADGGQLYVCRTCGDRWNAGVET